MTRRAVVTAGVVAVALALAAVVLLTPYPAAHGRLRCSLLGCSQTVNGSEYPVLVARDWTCSGGTTGTVATDCASAHRTHWLAPGERTRRHQDWDAFRVDAGWCYRVRFVLPYKAWTTTYDRIGQPTPAYVKVEDHAVAYVLAQGRTSCP